MIYDTRVAVICLGTVVKCPDEPTSGWNQLGSPFKGIQSITAKKEWEPSWWLMRRAGTPCDSLDGETEGLGGKLGQATKHKPPSPTAVIPSLH